MHFRMVGPATGQTYLMSADVKLGGPTIFIVISRAEEWPFVIENDSDHNFTVYQTVRVSAKSDIPHILTTSSQDLDHPDGPAGARALPTYTVATKSTLDYAWDYPSSREKKLVLNVNGSRRIVDPLEIGDLVPFKFSVILFTILISGSTEFDG